MPNRSLEFAEACSSRGAASTSSAPPSDALRKRRKRKQQAVSSESLNINDPDVDVWTLEATRISTSIKQLSTFLSSIRRAYLDLSHQHQPSLFKGKQSAENRDLDLSKGILEAWKDVRWLSDRERDEVDYQAKTMIRTCMARVKELETAEKNRHARTMSTLSRVPTSSFTKYLGLPANLLSSSAQQSEEQLNLHRQQVTVFLSRRLADVGKLQQEQQELRVKRQLERQNLSSNLSIPVSAMSNSSSSGNAKNALDDPAAVPSAFIPAPISYEDDDQDGYEPMDTVLSASQIQQFESESSALLQEANSQLAAIEKAQTSLLEISQMQTELAMHLGQQMELTDKLWEDSVLVTGRVEEGNIQLRKARERNREGRIWLLVFLIGASLSLLFLEYY